jgi:hypothetical protein
MSEDSHDDTVVVQGDVGETTHVEEAEKKQEGQQQNEEQILEGEELQADQELKQRVIARQEEKGKGELSAAEEVTDSKLPSSQQQQRKRTKKDATSATSKQREQQPNLYNLSKQLENHTRQLSRIGSIVEQLPKYLKNADTQSKIIKQINSSMNLLQKQVGRIQKSVQKKSKQR